MTGEVLRPPFILIAEDNEDDRVLLKYAFRSQRLPNPYLIVNDGAEVIAKLQSLADPNNPDRHPVDLLVLDIQMPNKTGIEVMEWVRNQPEYKKLAVVIMSGLQAPAVVDCARALGAHSYLFKPGDYGELMRFIQRFNQLPAYNLVMDEVPIVQEP